MVRTHVRMYLHAVGQLNLTQSSLDKPKTLSELNVNGFETLFFDLLASVNNSCVLFSHFPFCNLNLHSVDQPVISFMYLVLVCLCIYVCTCICDVFFCVCV